VARTALHRDGAHRDHPKAGFIALQRNFLLRLESKLALAGSSQFLWHVMRLPIRFFLQRNPVSSRCASGSTTASRVSRGSPRASLIAAVLVVFYVVLMLRYDVVLTLVGVALVAANLLAFRWFGNFRLANRRLSQEADASWASRCPGSSSSRL